LSDKYQLPVIFPCHPRTRENIQKFGLKNHVKDVLSENYSDQSYLKCGIYIVDPLGYNDFLYLWKDSLFVLTDSGGLQEETTAARIPCITLRENTERPVTAEIGTNTVVGSDMKLLNKTVESIVEGSYKKGIIPKFWDGKAAERIVEIINRTNTLKS
jgi:UDP-N-acetylglucosamine 2-epimerase (non-hydrolysing)